MQWKYVIRTLVGGIVGCGVSALAQAPAQPAPAPQQPAQPPRERPSGQPEMRAQDQRGMPGGANQGMNAPTAWHKATDIVGKDAHDTSDNDIGKIDNLVIAVDTGRVLFAVIPGDYVDKDAEQIAIPWSAVRLAPDAKYAIINTTKDRLAAAPAFGENQWPNMSDRNFISRVYGHFNAPPPQDSGEARHAGDPQPGGDPSRGNQGERSATAGTWHKASDLINKNLVDTAGKDIGQLDNLVIDMNSGHVLFAIIPGDSINKDDQQLAVPWQMLRLQPDAANVVLIADSATIQSAPSFDANKWPNLTDPTFMGKVYQHYNVRPYWQGQGMNQRGMDRPAGDMQRQRESEQPRGGGQDPNRR